MSDKESFKFDVVIGNPPYQDETVGDQKTYAPPVYHLFLDEAYKVGRIVEMIHPARFLFNAGSTPKKWNRKMLQDQHIKVVDYEPNGEKVFQNTDIKGGLAVTYRDSEKILGPINVFIPNPLLRSIFEKVKKFNEPSISTIIAGRDIYKFTTKLHEDHPEIKAMLSSGHENDIGSNTLAKLDNVVFFAKLPQTHPEEYVRIYGLINKKRVYRWIRRDYIREPSNFDAYKVLLPKANGNGTFGEVISGPEIKGPKIGYSSTFISVGEFHSQQNAKYALAYIKTKFTRSLLGILKRTQDNTAQKWLMVPLQNFTGNSDIDWSKSIPEIDQQLYKKYDLNQEEINFIESRVKAMDQ